MLRVLGRTLACISLLLTANLAVSLKASAHSLYQQNQPTPSELINAVNALRLSYGLAPLTVHPILMQTAQGQADALLASDGAVGHSRPNGLSYTDQLLILGYPLSGDLSLGGYRAENFVFGNGITPQTAVQMWLGDEPHTNTMLSPNFLNIGAGVAIASDGSVYYVIDCARPTSSGQPQEGAMLTVTVSANSPSSAVNQYIVPVAVNTARPDGDVLHRVQYGQSLWSIAIKYGTTINSIRALNNLNDTTVYEGQVLLIQKGATQPPPATAAAQTETPPAPDATASPSALPAPMLTSTALPLPQPTDSTGNGSSFNIWISVLLIVVVIGAGVAVWFIRTPGDAKSIDDRR